MLIELPHLGRYGANAVLCLSFGAQVGIVDANVARVLSRVSSLHVPVELHKAEELWDVATSISSLGDAREINLALLDLGALVCTARRPGCEACPLLDGCEYGRERVGVTAGGLRRQHR